MDTRPLLAAIPRHMDAPMIMPGENAATGRDSLPVASWVFPLLGRM
jgi:hypothetical protein